MQKEDRRRSTEIDRRATFDADVRSATSSHVPSGASFGRRREHGWTRHSTFHGRMPQLHTGADAFEAEASHREEWRDRSVYDPDFSEGRVDDREHYARTQDRDAVFGRCILVLANRLVEVSHGTLHCAR